MCEEIVQVLTVLSRRSTPWPSRFVLVLCLVSVWTPLRCLAGGPSVWFAGCED